MENFPNNCVECLLYLFFLAKRLPEFKNPFAVYRPGLSAPGFQISLFFPYFAAMRIASFFLLLIIFSVSAQAQQQQKQQAERAIRQVLDEQVKAWNQGDLEGYMQGYWQSDSLLFIGKSGLTYGWQQTLENYARSYPDSQAMGQLSFEVMSVRPVAEGKAYFVVGKWHLARKAGDLEGHYSLLFKRINQHWVIVADHSS